MAVTKKEAVPTVEKVSKQQEKRRVIQEILKYIVEKKDTMPKEIVEKALFAQRERSPRGTRKTPQVDNQAFLLSLIKEKKAWTTLELYTRFELTRSSFSSKYASALRKAAPADRLWFMYDKETRTYTYKSKGSNPPKGYTWILPPSYSAEP